MLRFAPSTTGDMHVGNLRVALFNYIVSKQRQEDLVIRMEETNKAENIEGKDNEIQDILGLFGIEYVNVLHQSENLRYHRMMAIQLLQDKKAFNCFCTPAELQKKRDLAKKANQPVHYDDTCAHLSPEMTIDNENPFTIRLQRPEASIVVHDLIKGDFTYTPDEVDAFVIMKAEKVPTYNFACAVDDMLSDISLVIRSEAYLNDTPKQTALRNALGYNKSMEYAHLPLLLNSEGEEETLSVKWLLEEGFLPSAITNYLISIGNTTPQETFTLKEAIEWFSLSDISASPQTFDLEVLKEINRAHLRNLEDKELSRYVGFADVSIGKVAKIYLEEAATLKELRPKIEAIFASKEIPSDFSKEAETLRKIIMNAPYFETFDDFKAHLAQESGLQGDALEIPLALLLTGSQETPNLAELYVHLKDFLGEIVK